MMKAAKRGTLWIIMLKMEAAGIVPGNRKALEYSPKLEAGQHYLIWQWALCAMAMASSL